MKKSEVKVKYTPDELQIIKEKAKKMGKTPNEYQREISKKAEVKVEIKNGF